MASSVNYKANAAGNTDTYVLQAAIGTVADEAYKTAKKLSGTAIVGGNDSINTDTETFIGQLRWTKPLNPTINVASVSNAADGTTTQFGQDMLTYVKTARTHGASKVNMTALITKEDGLAKVGRDFAETRAQDEHNAIMNVVRGVALSELLYGVAAAAGSAGLGGQTFTNDDTNMRYGFYVDGGASAKIIADATTTLQGAQRAQVMLDALGKGWKDYEPPYVYMMTSPALMASLRSANLVDQDRVQDGNIMLETLFSGKFRIIQTRANMNITSTDITKLNGGGGVDLTAANVNTTFFVLPGAIAMAPLAVPVPVEFDRDASAFQGGGLTEIWYRWGYVLHPAGYDWKGPTTDFVTDAQYSNVMEGSTSMLLSAATAGLAPTFGSWGRKTTSALSLGILPVLTA